MRKAASKSKGAKVAKKNKKTGGKRNRKSFYGTVSDWLANPENAIHKICRAYNRNPRSIKVLMKCGHCKVKFQAFTESSAKTIVYHVSRSQTHQDHVTKITNAMVLQSAAHDAVTWKACDGYHSDKDVNGHQRLTHAFGRCIMFSV